MDSVGESTSFRSRSNTWPKNPGLDTSLKNSVGRKYIYGNQTYADLIEKAIGSSPARRLTLSEIYQWLADTVPHFKDKTVSPLSWKNSVRHNLSLHGKFLRVQVDSKSMWTINPHPGEANNGRRKVYRGDKRNKRQINSEHRYCHNTTSHCKNVESICQAQVSAKENNSDQYHELQSGVGLYSAPVVDQVAQERSFLQLNVPPVIRYHAYNQQPILKPTEPFIENTFSGNMKEFTNHDCSFRPRSCSSSSSVSRSSLASSVDEATASIDMTGSRQRAPAVAAYFSSFRSKPNAEHEQKTLFAENKQNSVQLAANLELRADVVVPVNITAKCDNSDASFSFRQRSSSYSNGQLTKPTALRTLKSRPNTHIKDVPYVKHLVGNELFKPRSFSYSKNLSHLASAADMGYIHDKWSIKREEDLGNNVYQQQQTESGETKTGSSVYPNNFVNESAHRLCGSPRLYIQEDPKSRYLLKHSEPFRQRSYSNPNSRLFAKSQQRENVSKPHQVHMPNLNVMQPFRSRSNSNPMSQPTTYNKDVANNKYPSLTENMSPMVERLRFESNDYVHSSDFSSIKLEPLNFQENLDIGNIIKHELNIDGVLDFS